MFVCGSMEKIYDIALQWAKILNVDCFMTLDPHKIMDQIRPLVAVQLSVKVLEKRYDEIKEQNLSAVDTTPLLSNCE